MNDRDCFAAAALIRGMGVLGCEQIAKSCYEMADVMLRERERHHIPDAGKMVKTPTNHDAVPEARAGSDEARTDKAATSHRNDGTGDTPSEAEINALEFVVEVGRIANGWDKDILRQWLMRLRPEFYSPQAIKDGESDRPEPIDDEITRLRGQLAWTERERDSLRHAIDNLRASAETNPTQPRNGTPAECSAPREGSVPDSRNWNEPVAWAVVYPNDEVAIVAFKRRDADERASASDRVVPLYRSPTLTDEEREAVKWCRDNIIPMSSSASAFAFIHTAALRKLLERLNT